MKRLLCAASAAVLALALPAAAGAATWYVSNVANNGYALGVDTNNCTAVGTPCLTINGAHGKASAGDTIIVNPSGTCYSENSGSSYLAVTKALTIEGDPSLLASQGKYCLQGTSTTRTLNVQASATFINTAIDANAGGKSSALVVVQAAASTAAFSNVDIKNLTSTNYAFLQNGATTLILDKVSMTAANGNASTTGFVNVFTAGLTVNATGVNLSGIANGIVSTAHVATGGITVGASADGTRSSFANVATPIYYPYGGVQTLVDIESADFSGTETQAIYGGNSGAESVATFKVKSCNFTQTGPSIEVNGASGAYGSMEISYNVHNSPAAFIQANGMGFGNANVHHNTVTQTGATADPFLINGGTSGIAFANNKVTTDRGAGSNTGHVFQIGSDGQSTFSSNTAAATTTLKLGDQASDAFVYQPVTASVGGSAIPSSFSFQLSRVGSPTGTITAYLYSNNSGVPGSVLDTSDLTGVTLGSFSAASLTGTPTWYQFWLPDHPTITTGTYHVVLKYSGSGDASDYVALQANASGTAAGSSSNGTSWTAGSNAALFQFQYANFDLIEPVLHDNVVTITTTGTTGVHNYFCGGTLGCKMYNNQAYGGSISYIFKLTDGSNGSYPAIAFDNLAFQGNSTNGGRQLFRDKGARSATWYQNSAVMSGNGLSNVMTADNDYDPTNTPQYSGQPSQNGVFKNNILYGVNASGAAYIYVLGNATDTAGSVKVVNPTLNNNAVYFDGTVTPMNDIRSGVGTNVTTWAGVQALGFETNGVNADPKLSNEANPTKLPDFTPVSNSPAGGAGSPAVTVTVPSDFNGTSFLAPPDDGAVNRLRRTYGNRGYATNRVTVN